MRWREFRKSDYESADTLAVEKIKNQGKTNNEKSSNSENTDKKEDKKIKILFGITLSEIGGAQRVLYDIISSLSSYKYDITLVTSGNGELIRMINELNLNREYPVNIHILSNLKREISPISDIKTLYELFLLIKKDKFDIAHFHSSKMGIIGRLAAWFAGTKKIFFTVHGWGISDEMSNLLKKALGFMERLCGRICTSVICVSEHDWEKGIVNKYIKANKSCVIYNGIENRKILPGKLKREFRISDDTPIVGSVIRLMDPKLPQFTIKVAKELFDRGHKMKFFIIGGGPMYDECKEIIEKSGLGSKVILTGERKNASELMSDFNVLTLFSKSEGLPISILEGMLCGIPVVASKVGGIPELIKNGLNGYLVENTEIKRAADLIEKLVYSTEGRWMGFNGRKILLENFTKDKMVIEYEKLYLGDINKKKSKYNDISLSHTASKENEPHKLSRNFSWVFMGNTSYAVSKALLLMLVAKFGNVNMVGQFSLALAVTNPVFLLSNLRLRLVLATDNEGKYSFKDYMNLRAVTSIIGIFICILITLFYRGSLEQCLVIFLMAAARVFESISDIILGKFENREQMNVVGKSMMLKAFATTLMMGIPFYLTGNMVIGTAGLAASFLILLIFYDYRKARIFIDKGKKVDHKVLLNLIRISFPLGILQALVSLNGNISLFFIRGYYGTAPLGFYSSVAYLTVIGETVNMAIGQSITPRLSKYYLETDKKKYMNVLTRSVAASTILGISGIIAAAGFGGFILSIVYTPEYAGYWDLFMLQMVAACSNYIGGALSNSITAARKFKIQPFLYCMVILFNAVFLIILVPSRGLEGAVYAVIISSYVSMTGNLLANIFLIWK